MYAELHGTRNCTKVNSGNLAKTGTETGGRAIGLWSWTLVYERVSEN